jgi:hypothetical protein
MMLLLLLSVVVIIKIIMVIKQTDELKSYYGTKDSRRNCFELCSPKPELERLVWKDVQTEKLPDTTAIFFLKITSATTSQQPPQKYYLLPLTII